MSTKQERQVDSEKKRGRPSEYTQEIADQICARLANGESLRTVCKPDDMPDKATVFRWIRSQPGFCDQYAKAKHESSDALVEEMLDIADDVSRDTVETDGGPRQNGEWIARSRLRVDTRKWIASKLKPKKYGEKLELAGDPSAPLVTRIERTIKR